MRRVLALLLITAAAVVAAPAIASGGEGPELDVDLASPIEPLTFTATFEEETCVEGEFDSLVLANGNEIVPISATQNDENPDQFIFVLPSGTPPGTLAIEIECDDGDGTETAGDEQEWAALGVTKTVSGPAPSGAAFTVNVDCIGSDEPDTPVVEGFVGAADLPPDFDVDLHYGVAGGLHYVYVDELRACTITEPVTGGATSVSIVEPVVVLVAPAPFTATVTNTFAAALQPNFTG